MDSDDLWRMIANAFLIVVAVGVIFWFVAKPLEKAIMGNQPQTPAQTDTQTTTTTTTGSPAAGIPVGQPNNTLPTATPVPSQGAPLGTTTTSSPAPAQTAPVQPPAQTAPATTE
jgi:hypothetical protein